MEEAWQRQQQQQLEESEGGLELDLFVAAAHSTWSSADPVEGVGDGVAIGTVDRRS